MNKNNKNTTFEVDLTDKETLRAKLVDIVSELEEREREADLIQAELDRAYEAIGDLKRVHEGLLVMLGDKQAESDEARFGREGTEERMEAQRRAAFEQWRQRSAATIQAQVENLVNSLGRQVSAADLLGHLPAGTKPEAVNYALWRAADKKRIQKVSRGVYAANPPVPETATNEGR
jgi:chromosome segregation ATPase